MNAPDIFQLADVCKVSMNAACKRVGVSYSTVHRAKKGSETKQATIDKLRAGILMCAKDAGTIPAEYETEASLLAEVHRPPRDPVELARSIQRDAKELAKALAS